MEKHAPSKQGWRHNPGSQFAVERDKKIGMDNFLPILTALWGGRDLVKS